MPTIRQMYSGVFTNYRTQFSNGQIFRSTNRFSVPASSLTTRSPLNEIKPIYNAVQNNFYSEFAAALNGLQKGSGKNFSRNYLANLVPLLTLMT